LPIIQKWVSPKATYIISDEWRAYNGLKKLHFNHKTIKHKDNFVNPNNRIIHTQTIENRWGQIKSMMKKEGE